VFNPSRRNKNIGKTQGGRVKDGVAAEKQSRWFPQSLWRQLSEAPRKGLVVVTENPSRDYYYPCSAEEVRAVIARLPSEYSQHLRAVIFRRISRRDQARGTEAYRRMRCIVLNAFPVSNEIDWGKSPPAESARKHYASWCDVWQERDGRWIQTWTAEQARRYHLYHLLLHELGHINQPPFHSLRRRESFAEDFALTWARKLKQL